LLSEIIKIKICGTATLLVAYVSVKLDLQIKRKHKLSMSKNGAQSSICGIKGRNKRQKIVSFVLLITFYYGDQSKRMSSAEHSENMGRMEMLTYFWLGNPEG
jgi:hypothetical protein